MVGVYEFVRYLLLVVGFVCLIFFRFSCLSWD